jgi:oligopeptide/dipeptide ABC transporter ATP-binding protein
LINSIPVLGEVKERLDVIEGNVPNLINLPPGCRFAPRCRAYHENGLTICTKQMPDLQLEGINHSVRCWLYQEVVRNHSQKNFQKPLK